VLRHDRPSPAGVPHDNESIVRAPVSSVLFISFISAVSCSLHNMAVKWGWSLRVT